jgi:hypothetical protein
MWKVQGVFPPTSTISSRPTLTSRYVICGVSGGLTVGKGSETKDIAVIITFRKADKKISL